MSIDKNKYPALKNEENVEFLYEEFVYLKEDGEVVMSANVLEEFMKIDLEDDYLPFWDIPSGISRKSEIDNFVKNGPNHDSSKKILNRQKEELELRKKFGGSPPLEDALLSKEGRKNMVNQLLEEIESVVNITFDNEEEKHIFMSRLKEQVSKEKYPIKFLRDIMSIK
tara:strand:+ start:68 stop:571 length:504 start_codon:yes stop_codon:yes gene_type:complete